MAQPRAAEGLKNLQESGDVLKGLMKQLEGKSPKPEPKKEPQPKEPDANKGKWKGELPVMPWDK